MKKSLYFIIKMIFIVNTYRILTYISLEVISHLQNAIKDIIINITTPLFIFI